MKHNFQAVEMSVHLFLNWNESFRMPATCQSARHLTTGFFYFWFSLSPLDCTRARGLQGSAYLFVVGWLLVLLPHDTAAVCWLPRFGQAWGLRAALSLGQRVPAARNPWGAETLASSTGLLGTLPLWGAARVWVPGYKDINYSISKCPRPPSLLSGILPLPRKGP